MKLAVVRAGSICLGLALLQACGGGGGDSGGQNNPPEDPQPRLSVDTTTIVVSAMAGEETPRFDVIANVTNIPAEGLWTAYGYSTDGIASVDFNSYAPGQGIYTIGFKSPVETPDGTYNDSVTIRVCIDRACAEDIENSPVSIRTTYTVRGTQATLSHDQSSWTTDGRDINTHRETFHVTYGEPLVDGPFYQVSFPGNGLESVYPANVSPTQTDVYVDYKPGAALPFGRHDDTIELKVCYDYDCVKQLRGSPLTINTSLEVTTIPEAGYDALEVASRVPLGHDVVDAEFSSALNTIVMVSRNPTNALYLYDVATGVQARQELAQEPISVSLRPDGLAAAIGHSEQISIVQLETVGQAGAPAPVLVDAGVDGNELVFDGNGKVHVFPDLREGEPPRTVDIATNTIQMGSGIVFRRARARLHRSGTAIYEANTVFTPTHIGKWDISTGVAVHQYDFPDFAIYDVCGNLWFKAEGDLIYTACGTVFTSSPVQADDLQYAGTMPMTNTAAEGLFSHVIRSLSEDISRNEIAVVEAPKYCETVFLDGPCYTHFALYDRTTLERKAIYAIQPVTVDDVSYPQLGHFVFQDATNTRKYLISRLDLMPDPAAQFYLSVIE